MLLPQKLCFTKILNKWFTHPIVAVNSSILSIKTILIHHLPRLRKMNANRTHKIKLFRIKKDKKQMISSDNITDVDLADHLGLLANTYAQTEFLLHGL